MVIIQFELIIAFLENESYYVRSLHVFFIDLIYAQDLKVAIVPNT